MTQPKNPAPDIQGEGNYDAGRKFQKAEQAFVKSGQVDKKAREAADAVEGPEGAELEEARTFSAKGEPAAKH